MSIWLLFMTGLRVNEACALKWEDIDLENGILTVNKTLVYKNKNNYRFSTPKTKASIRKIVLDKTTLDLLIDWKREQSRNTDTEFMLSFREDPASRLNIENSIKRYSKIAEVDRIRVHDLRHSHASLLINLGENPLIIKERLGHNDVKTTLGTYGHLYPSVHNEVANKLSNLVSI